MKHKVGLPVRIIRVGAMGSFLLAGSILGWPQAASTPAAQPTDAMAAAVRELQEEVRELRTAVVELRSEAGEYRAETEQLRKQLQATQSSATPPEGTASGAPTASGVSSSQTPPLEDRVASLEESAQLLNSKIDDQNQTKIETASKYRVRLSGIALFNIFSNHGNVDNQDFPTWANPANSSASRPDAGRESASVGDRVGSIRPAFGGSKDDRQRAGRLLRRICQYS